MRIIYIIIAAAIIAFILGLTHPTVFPSMFSNPPAQDPNAEFKRLNGDMG